MQYKCENCRRRFEFDDIIEFCPYCGKRFDNAALGPGMSDPSSDLAQAIDSIWGYGAKAKSEFSDAIYRCISLVNTYAEESVGKTLPKQDLSKYEKNYAAIKQSNNRKTLISRMDNFLDNLEIVIDNLSDRIPANAAQKLDGAISDTEDMVKELYDFLGVRYTSSNVDYFAEDTYSAEVLYTREQLKTLYNLVMVAYAKYKKCVEDNNMFAAFGSTSNYGIMTDYWRRWLSRLSAEEDSEDTQEKEEPKYDEVVSYMKEQNAKRYFGMLDEDFVPHVDAFWYGLEMLCDFIDHHIVVECDTEYLRIGENEKAKLMRVIESKSFEVSESRLEFVLELRERFEEKIRALHETKINN